LVDRITIAKWANGKVVDSKVTLSWSAGATRRPGVENKQSAVHTRFSERQRGRSEQSTSGRRTRVCSDGEAMEGGNEGGLEVSEVSEVNVTERVWKVGKTKAGATGGRVP
jgi:hypothetical protein